MTRQGLELIEGILIGAGGILPGISGAALAVVFGIYEELTALLAHPKREWRRFLGRRWVLALGIAGGFVSFTVLLRFVFAQWTVPLVYLFTGFIAGTLPGMFRDARKKEGIPAGALPSGGETTAFLAAAGILLALGAARHAGIGPFAAGDALENLAASAAAENSFPLRWVLAGALIGMGSLLPGFSASFVLILLGMYEPLLQAAGSLDLPVLAQLGSGALASLLLFSRLVAWLYRKAHGIMSFGVLGFTIGSLVLAFPGFPQGFSLALSLSLAAAGFLGSLSLESALKKND